MSVSDTVLICFALPEEARPFERRLAGRGDLRLRVTGMGRKNADSGVRAALRDALPAWVITAGFAGGLDPALARGTVVFEADAAFPRGELLHAAGARPARFHCAERIAATAGEKRRLREATGADAVEMESGVIQAVCREAGIPCATVRVISDIAEEDLPLDFNRFTQADGSLDLGGLLWAIARSPGLIGPLLRLQRHTREAARRLAEVLDRVTADRRS